ncbi:PQQ-binding-like beta-propeller repeat protein, partial [Chloroflexota bacterium]
IVLLVGLTFSGCAGGGTVPRGWSGGAIADDTLFVGSMAGKVVAVDTIDGSRLWGVTIETSEPARGFGCAPASTSVAIYGSPAVTEDLVFVGGYNGIIYAFNLNTGALRWVYPRQGHLQPIVGGPVVALGNVYFASADGKVYALDAETGDSQWVFETGDKIWATPAIVDDTLFIGSFDNKLYALNATNGSKKWDFQTEGAIVSVPLVNDDTVYVGSFDRYLYALNVTDGSVRWKSMSDNWFWAKPVIHNDVIYASSLDGKVYALNAESGKKLTEFDLGSPVSSSPVLVDDLLVVVATEERKEEARIYTIDTNNNQQKLLVNLEEKVYAPLAASQGIVYIHTAGDTLYAVDAQSGAIREFNIRL